MAGAEYPELTAENSTDVWAKLENATLDPAQQRSAAQTLLEACESFLRWLDRSPDGTGEGHIAIRADPAEFTQHRTAVADAFDVADALGVAPVALELISHVVWLEKSGARRVVPPCAADCLIVYTEPLERLRRGTQLLRKYVDGAREPGRQSAAAQPQPKQPEEIGNGKTAEPSENGLRPTERPTLRIDTAALLAYWNDGRLAINCHADFRILAALYAEIGKLVTYTALLAAVKSKAVADAVQVTEAPPEVKDAVSHIRAAFRKAGCTWKIECVRQCGYRFLPDE